MIQGWTPGEADPPQPPSPWKNQPFLRRTEHLWERCGCGRTSGRLLDERCLLSHPSILSFLHLSSVHKTPTSHSQILRLMAAGSGERRLQMQGFHFCDCTSYLWAVAVCFPSKYPVQRSHSCLLLFGETKKRRSERFTQLSDCSMLMVSEH